MKLSERFVPPTVYMNWGSCFVLLRFLQRVQGTLAVASVDGEEHCRRPSQYKEVEAPPSVTWQTPLRRVLK